MRNKRLKKHLENLNIITYRSVSPKQWLVTHDNQKLLDEWENIRFGFPRLKLKPLNEYKDAKDFYNDWTTNLDDFGGSGSYEHKYLHNTKNSISNYYFDKYCEENKDVFNENYFELIEANYWENERWSCFVLDTQENRTLITYLRKRFFTMKDVVREKVYNFFNVSFKPVATSRFSFGNKIFSKIEIEEMFKNSCSTTKYMSKFRIDKTINLKLEELEKLSDDDLISVFYKGKIKNYAIIY